jgi:hypothetical protein
MSDVLLLILVPIVFSVVLLGVAEYTTRRANRRNP